MARSLGVLDRVVVTGSAVGAPERELTVGLNVLNGRQLSRESSGTLSGALDTYVPGVWSWAQSPASMLSSYASIRGASSFGLSYPKIYIDGIEVANPLLVTRFSPDAIDRIEVIRGPQGSALYGTDAISGVVNIVTRHEGASGDGTRASLRTTAGVSQSAFTHSVLAQDHSLSLVSGTSTRSADLHVSGGSIGAFIPDGYSRDLLASGSARIVGTNSTIAATARFFMEQAGTPNSPLLAGSIARTIGTDAINSGLVTQPADTPQSVRQYTIGTTGTFTPGTVALRPVLPFW
jgi:outer membrane receptor protein involved in Fe transport